MPIYDIEEQDIEILYNCPICDSSDIEIISEVCEKDKKKLTIDFDYNFTEIIPKRKKYYFFSTAYCNECYLFLGTGDQV